MLIWGSIHMSSSAYAFMCHLLMQGKRQLQSQIITDWQLAVVKAFSSEVSPCAIRQGPCSGIVRICMLQGFHFLVQSAR